MHIGGGFISATDGLFQTLEFDGMFGITDTPNMRTNLQALKSISQVSDTTLLMEGTLTYKDPSQKSEGFTSYVYTLNLTRLDDGNLGFVVTVTPVIVRNSNQVRRLVSPVNVN